MFCRNSLNVQLKTAKHVHRCQAVWNHRKHAESSIADCALDTSSSLLDRTETLSESPQTMYTAACCWGSRFVSTSGSAAMPVPARGWHVAWKLNPVNCQEKASSTFTDAITWKRQCMACRRLGLWMIARGDNCSARITSRSSPLQRCASQQGADHT